LNAAIKPTKYFTFMLLSNRAYSFFLFCFYLCLCLSVILSLTTVLSFSLYFSLIVPVSSIILYVCAFCIFVSALCPFLSLSLFPSFLCLFSYLCYFLFLFLPVAKIQVLKFQSSCFWWDPVSCDGNECRFHKQDWLTHK